MAQSYPIPAQTVTVETVVKNSRFIAQIAHATDSDTAQQIINQIKSQYPDARHHCWAYICGAPNGSPNNTKIRFNDDGEPSGTAGKPILNVLQHSGIGEIVAVVTRYFGGVKLGAGGLVRAYSSSTQAAMDELTTEFKQAMIPLTLTFPFAQEAQVRQLLSYYQAELLTCRYELEVIVDVQLPDNRADEFTEQLTNQTKGQAHYLATQTEPVADTTHRASRN